MDGTKLRRIYNLAALEQNSNSGGFVSYACKSRLSFLYAKLKRRDRTSVRNSKLIVQKRPIKVDKLLPIVWRMIQKGNAKKAMISVVFVLGL